MNIVYKLKGVKEVKRLYVRVYFNRLDITVGTNIMLLESQWNSENESVIGEPEITIGLSELKLAILKRFNKDYILGVLIDKKWVENTVKTSFMRPKNENKLINPDYSIYLSDFADYWLEDYSGSWKVSSRKVMGKVLKSQYESFVEILKKYEAEISEKLQLRNLSIVDITGFVEYLESEDYQPETVKRMTGRLRFFMNRANELNFEVNQSYKQRIYFAKEEEMDGVYLNEREINSIIQKDFSFDPELNIAKQNLVILLNTGLRGNDFLKNLDIKNFQDDFIKIKTQKTGQTVVIPINRTVKEVLKQNFGNLPPKMTLHDFNKAIKTICMICDIDEPMEGKLFDSKKKRKVKGLYPKYKLLSSHAARRGFSTLYKGKISDKAICSILGWSDEKMLSVYNKTTQKEYAEELKNYWENK